MKSLKDAVNAVLTAQAKSKKPLSVILAGHNGSGKSTMWYRHLATKFQIPLINADRMMMSILPEVTPESPLPEWAAHLRDGNQSWMQVAQQGVEAFVAQAIAHDVPFALETVFSYWKRLPDGQVASKIDLIKELQQKGYFVLLFFVGLTNHQLSIARVSTRVAAGGHDVETQRLIERFPRTQMAIRSAVGVADASLLVDNSREFKDAFTVCRIQMGQHEIYDRRHGQLKSPPAILEWLNVVSPNP